MNFLGIGPFEILLILIIAVIVLGPERMATTGRTLGRLYAQYRNRWQRDVDEMTRELRQELSMLQMELDEIRQTTESEIQAAQSAIEKSVNTEIDLDTTLLSSRQAAPSVEPAAPSPDEQPAGAEVTGTVAPPEPVTEVPMAEAAPQETETTVPVAAPTVGDVSEETVEEIRTDLNEEAEADVKDEISAAALARAQTLEGRVGGIETRLDQIEGNIEQRLGEIEGAIESIETHLRNIEVRWRQAEEEI